MDRQSYFMEQLCMIGVAAIYAIAMTVMYLTTATNPGANTLLSIIVPWIRHVVFGGSIVLCALVAIRAIAVWKLAGTVSAHSHAHDHHHHDHDHLDHDHSHSHDHDHHHDHVHDHAHSPGEVHFHGWSPWQYAVLLFPLMLILVFNYSALIGSFQRWKLGSAQTADIAGLSERAGESLMVTGQALSISTNPLDHAFAAMVTKFYVPQGEADAQVAEKLVSVEAEIDRLDEKANQEAVVVKPDIRQLIQAADSSDSRSHWKDYRRVQLLAMLKGSSADGRMFEVGRLTMACCINDSQQFSVPVLNRSRLRLPPPSASKDPTWILVEGRVDFAPPAKPGDKWQTVLKANKVSGSPPPPKPYLD